MEKPDPAFAAWYAEKGQGSGPGSHPGYTATYQRWLEDFIRRHYVFSVVDLGCGDWQFSKCIDWGRVDYCGMDIVPSLIEKLNAQYGASKRRFKTVDPGNLALPIADLLIVKDVLQHISNDKIHRIIRNFHKYKFILLTNDKWPDPELNNREIDARGYRLLDLSAPPFSLKGNYVFYFGPEFNKYTFFIQNCAVVAH